MPMDFDSEPFACCGIRMRSSRGIIEVFVRIAGEWRVVIKDKVSVNEIVRDRMVSRGEIWHGYASTLEPEG